MTTNNLKRVQRSPNKNQLEVNIIFKLPIMLKAIHKLHLIWPLRPFNYVATHHYCVRIIRILGMASFILV